MKIVTSSALIIAMIPIISNACNPKIPEPRQISVKATSVLDVPADYVNIRVSISTTDKSVEVAYAQNTLKVKQTLKELEAVGIPQRDISSGYVSLRKREAERENDAPIFLGYEAENHLTIILRKVSSYDLLMAAIIRMGVDSIDSVTFAINNEQEKRKEARLLAVKAAKEKAEYLANGLGQKVCEPLSIAESGQVSYSGLENSYSYSAPQEVSSSLVPNNIRISASIEAIFHLCD